MTKERVVRVENRHKTHDEQPKPVEFEPPRIEDYGTLAELTAGSGDGKADFFSGQGDGGGGGYS
jgi:hypothetical protein